MMRLPYPVAQHGRGNARNFSSTTSKKVLIIGAGTVGPLIALALKRAQFHPVLFDSVAKFGDVGGGLSLAPNGLLFLKNLGLLEKVYQQGCPVKSMSINTLEGHPVLTLSGKSLYDQYGFFLTGIRRSRLHQIMMDQVAQENIPVHLSKRLNDIRQSDSSISACFEDGSVVEGDLLLGCDGLKSVTRQLLWGKENPRFTGIEANIGIANWDSTLRFRPGHSEIFRGKGKSMGIFGIGQNEILWFIAQNSLANATESWVQDQGPERAQRIVTELKQLRVSRFAQEVVSKSNRVLRYGIFDRPPLNSWTKGRATLVGDAAHPMPPHFGQGANTALEDGGVLTELMKLKSDPLEAFSIYENVRIKRVDRILKISHQMGEINTLSNPMLCKLRDIVTVAALFALGKPPLDETFAYNYQKVAEKAAQKNYSLL
jgi:salicylate hydroxylase